MLRRFRKKLQTSDWRPAENDFWWCPPKKPRVFRDYIVALDHFPKFWVVDEVHFLKKLLILVFKWCTYYIISWHIYIYHLQPYRYHCFHSTPTPPHKSPRNHPPKQTTTFFFHGPPPKKIQQNNMFSSPKTCPQHLGQLPLKGFDGISHHRTTWVHDVLTPSLANVEPRLSGRQRKLSRKKKNLGNGNAKLRL